MRIGAVFNVSGTMPDWSEIYKRYGFVAHYLLNHIGMKAARSLYYERLDMTLNPASFSPSKAPLSERGRRMVSYSVDKDNKHVIIRSYPLNVLRRGPGPRTAKRTLGGQIFRSFAASFDASAAAREALDMVIEKESESYPEWTTKLHKSRSRRTGKI
jgi:hypothetical protein